MTVRKGRSSSGRDGEFHETLLAILAELREDAKRADARLEHLEIWRHEEEGWRREQEEWRREQEEWRREQEEWRREQEGWRLQMTANMDSVARSLQGVAVVLREHEERWHENDARMETVARTLATVAEVVDGLDRRVTRLEGDRGAA